MGRLKRPNSPPAWAPSSWAPGLGLLAPEGVRPLAAAVLVTGALVHAVGVVRMERTLEQLLLLARLEAGDEMDRSLRADACAAARQAIAEVEASRRVLGKIAVESRLPAGFFRVPETLLVSALRNLLDNAVRASSQDAQVELRIDESKDGHATFEVLDRGPGMSEEECAMATRRFWRRSKAADGSGLGLAIVRAIAQRYAGSVRLAPRPGGGLRAELELPFASGN